jgi:hypothetical protein
MMPGMSGVTTAVPEVEFFKTGNRLVVQSCDDGIPWTSINISMNGAVIQPLSGNVSAGQEIIGMTGHVTVVYKNTLIGTYDFT